MHTDVVATVATPWLFVIYRPVVVYIHIHTPTQTHSHISLSTIVLNSRDQ